MSNYNIIQNNSQTRYGTASLVKSSLTVDEIILHHSGRIIFFNIGEVTFGNIYLPSGTDGPSRNSSENFCGETILNLMINSKLSGKVGGDWKNFISKEDCTRHPKAKMSPCLKRLVGAYSLKDVFRQLHPEIRN